MNRRIGGRHPNRKNYYLVLGAVAMVALGLIYLTRQRSNFVPTSTPASTSMVDKALAAPADLMEKARVGYASLLKDDPPPQEIVERNGVSPDMAETIASQNQRIAQLEAQLAARGQQVQPQPAKDPDAERRKQEAIAAAKVAAEELKAARNAGFAPIRHDKEEEKKTGHVTITSAPALAAGTHVSCILDNGINSEHENIVVARVTAPVYDSATLRKLVIPQDAELIGTYDQALFGDNTLAVRWNTLQYKRHNKLISVDLEDQPGGDRAGQAGLPGKVNHKWGRLITSLVFRSVLDASQVGLNMVGRTAGGQVGRAVGQGVVQEGETQTQRSLNVSPSIMVAQGTRCSMTVKERIELPEVL